MSFNPTQLPDELRCRFESALSAFCAWSLERDVGGCYVDGNTAFAWLEFLRINVQDNAREAVQR